MATLPWASHCPIDSLKGTCGCLMIGFILLQILIARNAIDPKSLVAFNLKKSLLVCAPIANGSMGQLLASMAEAKAEGADLVELRMISCCFPTSPKLRSSSSKELCLQFSLLAMKLPSDIPGKDDGISKGISSTSLRCSPMSRSTKQMREDEVDEAILAAAYKKIR
ncbi:Aldolase-type TIM barrel [Trema orientale]|uniref:Aldolase-type TIM barrel n=1 Tax=Trema orientale TaxID=63057 RepID=A0A2P5EPS2_TREOI|nr:Aldolase-type TIM barrel [Trema orientale]